MRRGGFYNTGAVGAAFTVFNVIYIFGLIGYYATSLSFICDVPTSSIFGIFLIWSTLKPLVPLFSAIWGALQITNLVLAFILVVIIGGIWVGTIGLLSKLLFDFATTCNTPKDFNNLCNDLRYCCVYHDQVPSCTGFGPCPGPDNPQTPADLSVNSDFTIIVIFTLFFFAIELILILLSFGTYRARAKEKQKRQLLYNNYTNKAFESSSSRKGGAGTVDTTRISPSSASPSPAVSGNITSKLNDETTTTKNVNTRPFILPPPAAPSWFNILRCFDDAIDGLIPHITGYDKFGNAIAIYARRYYDEINGNRKYNNTSRKKRNKPKIKVNNKHSINKNIVSKSNNVQNHHHHSHPPPPPPPTTNMNFNNTRNLSQGYQPSTQRNTMYNSKPNYFQYQNRQQPPSPTPINYRKVQRHNYITPQEDDNDEEEPIPRISELFSSEVPYKREK